jgi:hypothetical protein
MFCAVANIATIIITPSTEIIIFMARLIFEFEGKIVAVVFSTTATGVD